MPEEPAQTAEATGASMQNENTEATQPEIADIDPEAVSYQAVEKEGEVTAIWEMQGQKHLRTIDPRSHEGKQILALFETAG